MKICYWILCALGLTSGFAMSDEEQDPGQQVAAALGKWTELKQQCGGNYSYTVFQASVSGYRQLTRIKVENNQVVERTYQASMPTRGPGGGDGVEWTERGDLLGRHDEGAPVKTLDELYAEVDDIMQRTLRRGEERVVNVDKQGLLLSCMVINTRIMDDAPHEGVHLSRIDLVVPDPDEVKEGAEVHRAPNGKPFPAHWGAPPEMQTFDIRPLPGDYGQGSSTLGAWIQQNIDRDARNVRRPR